MPVTESPAGLLTRKQHPALVSQLLSGVGLLLLHNTHGLPVIIMGRHEYGRRSVLLRCV